MAVIKVASGRLAKKVGAKAGAKVAAKVGGKVASKYVPYVGQALMVAEAAPVALESAGETYGKFKTGLVDTVGHLKKKQFGAAVKSHVVGLTEGSIAAAKGVAKTGIAALTAKELADAVIKNPDAPMSFDEYIAWRESPRVEIAGMMGQIPSLPRHGLNKLLDFNHPMSWMVEYELAYRDMRRRNPRKARQNTSYRYPGYHDGRMVRNFLQDIEQDARSLQSIVREEDDLPQWVNYKIYTAADRLQAASRYMERESVQARLPLLPSFAIVARSNPRSSDVGMFQGILAHLRALHWLYWTTHWTSSGPNYYGDHLLLQRLYEGKGGGPDIDAEIDALGERMVAYFGPASVQPSAINQKVQEVLHGKNGLPGLLDLEKQLQVAIRQAWKANQESGEEFSLGIDDYLMGLANERDTAIYLLRQRLGK